MQQMPAPSPTFVDAIDALVTDPGADAVVVAVAVEVAAMCVQQAEGSTIRACVALQQTHPHVP